MTERTEAPTPHRLREARRKGQVAKSVEINTAAILLAAFWIMGVLGPLSYDALRNLMQRSFTALSVADLTFSALRTGGLTIAGLAARAIGPFLLVLLLVGIVANLLQTGLLFSLEALQPDPKRINPLNGLKRLFSERGLVELIKSLFKLTAIGLVVFLTLRSNAQTIMSTSRMSLVAGLSALFRVGGAIGWRVALAILALALADYLFQRWSHIKGLRMTKQEVKEEMKRMENPQLKARIRTRQRQLAMSRMMAAVPESDVVITNPTHLAVALRYDRGQMQAPQVVAKGQRLLAERIKAKAQAHHVPLVENKSLARNLFKSVELGQMIPLTLYQAVAEVLAFVYRLKSVS